VTVLLLVLRLLLRFVLLLLASLRDPPGKRLVTS
jgi:hypothetical protein